MKIGVLPPGDPGVFRSLLLEEAARALTAGVPLTALAATEGDVAVGALAGYLEDDWFRIQSLYVAPQYRRGGAGRQLLTALETVLPDRCAGLVVRFTVTQEEHEELCAFLTAMGFADETEGEQNLYMTTLSRLAELPFFGKGRSDARLRSFATLDALTLRIVSRRAMLDGAPLPEGGLASPGVERDISTALVRNGTLLAYAVFDRSCLHRLTLAALFEEEGSGDIPLLLRESFVRARELYPPEEEIVFQAIDDNVLKLIREFVPEAKIVSRAYRKGEERHGTI
ncbi:MAG: GNAT family N-acetyltransferase [Lachnospiraceae bacterium]|nr:GNAT family N-acetyltransferase [Lachnospiraceae bacterium]